TRDGLAIARAVVEHLHARVGARALFATHYHELVGLAADLPRLRNLHTAVREDRGEVIFLHRVIPGGADRSYGLHGARLAGLPADVLVRAATLLAEAEGPTPPGPPHRGGEAPAECTPSLLQANGAGGLGNANGTAAELDAAVRLLAAAE